MSKEKVRSEGYGVLRTSSPVTVVLSTTPGVVSCPSFTDGLEGHSGPLVGVVVVVHLSRLITVLRRGTGPLPVEVTRDTHGLFGLKNILGVFLLISL